MGTGLGQLAEDAALALFFASSLFFTTIVPLRLYPFGAVGQILFVAGLAANMVALGYIAVRMPRVFSAAVAVLYSLFFVLSVLSKYFPSAILHFLLLTFPIAWLAYVNRMRAEEIWNALRAHGRNWLPLAALGGAATVFLLYPTVIIEGLILRAIGVQDVGKVSDVILNAPLWLAVFSFMFAPLSEEVFFRGFLFGRLRKFGGRFGSKKAALIGAAIVSSAVFASAHYSYGSVTEIVGAFTIGLIFVGIFVLTDSLVAVIAAHAVFNLISVCVIYLANYIGEEIPVGLLH